MPLAMNEALTWQCVFPLLLVLKGSRMPPAAPWFSIC